MHPSTKEILRYFAFEHLTNPDMRRISARCHDLAADVAGELDGPELTAGLRKLLEAKDCFVRAALPKQDT